MTKHTSTRTQNEKDDKKYNRLYQVKELALIIERNNSMMTQSEAMQEAKKRIAAADAQNNKVQS